VGVAGFHSGAPPHLPALIPHVEAAADADWTPALDRFF